MKPKDRTYKDLRLEYIAKAFSRGVLSVSRLYCFRITRALPPPLPQPDTPQDEAWRALLQSISIFILKDWNAFIVYIWTYVIHQIKHLQVMKKFSLVSLFAVLLSLSPIHLFAQDQNGDLAANMANLLRRTYLRPSLSLIYVTDGSPLAEGVVEQLKKIPNNKFDVNELATNTFELRDADLSTKEGVDSLRQKIADLLNEEKVGNQILGNWFPVYDETQKMYTTDVLIERGQYGATADDVIRATASQRGKDIVLNSLGESLIDRSYLVVNYIYTLTSDDGTQSLDYSSFVYKLDFNEVVMNDFYTNYFSSPTGVQDAPIPMKYVYDSRKKENGMLSAQNLGKIFRSGIAKREDGSIDYVKTAMDMFVTIDNLLTQNVNDFQIKTAIIALNPIQAKIGKKEGLITDRRFYVMENVQTDEGDIVAKRRGAIRVGSYIADNVGLADVSSTDFTKFYQYSGGILSEGMTLVEMPDLGIGFTPYLTYMHAGLEIDYRFGDLFSNLLSSKGFVPGLFVYLRAALPFSTTDTSNGKFGVLQYISAGDNEVKTPVRIGFGLRKEFNFAHLLNVSGTLGFDAYAFDESTNNDSYIYAINAGARFGVYVTPSINVFAMAEYSLYLVDGFMTASGVEAKAADFGISPFNFGIGVRLGI